jgi:hypothetical protein
MKNFKKSNQSIQWISLVFTGLILSSILFYSCKKEGSIVTPITKNSTEFQLSENVSASIAGTVVQENGNPAKNVMVRIGVYSTTTNDKGEFLFESITAPKNHAHIIVQAEGYFDGHRTLRLAENATEFTKIKLLKKELTKSFKSQDGSIVNLKDGGKIVFEANSIINEQTGAMYNGNVNVYAKWIDPTSEDLDETTPGCLRGITAANNEEGLLTMGMFAVELQGANGEDLQIKSGNTAELRFPIPNELMADANETIPSWSLDENIGLWVEEGTLTKYGNEYVGDVTHFSFWNADIPTIVNFSVEFQEQGTNAPLQGYRVKLIRQSNNLYSYGFTNSLGQANGGIVPNENYTMELTQLCAGSQQLINTTNFSVGAGSLNMGVIHVALSGNSSADVTGTLLDGNNMPLGNNSVSIKVAGFSGYPNVIKTDAQGNFTYSTPICTQSMDLEIIGYDSIGLMNSGAKIFTVTPGQQNIGNLLANAEHSEYVKITSLNWGITTHNIIAEPQANFNCYKSLNRTSFNCFSRIPAQNWSCNLQVDGGQNLGGHNLRSYYDRLGNINTVGWTLDAPVSLSIKEFSSVKGEFITAAVTARFLSPNQMNTRSVFMRRDN